MTTQTNNHKLLLIALISSLAINLLFIGAIVGRVLNGPPAGPFPNHLGWIVRDLDPAVRQTLAPELQAHAQKVRPVRQEMRLAQRAFHQALLADPLDDVALATALNDLEQTSSTYQALMHSEMLNIFRKLNPDERARAAKFLRHQDRRRKSKHDNSTATQAKP